MKTIFSTPPIAANFFEVFGGRVKTLYDPSLAVQENLPPAVKGDWRNKKA